MNFYRKQRGVAAVELALLLGFILVPLAFGITELGRAIYQYNTLVKATRDAARFLSEQSAGNANSIAVATCLAVYGNKTCTGSVLAPNLTTSMVSVCDSVNSSTCPSELFFDSGMNMVRVSITGYQFTSLVPIHVTNINFGPISTKMRQAL